MKLGVVISTLLIAVLPACSNSSEEVVQTTTTVVDIGSDCNQETFDLLEKFEADYMAIRDKSIWPNGTATISDINDLTDAILAMRSYIRSLDVPVMSLEKDNYVDVLQKYYEAFNDYVESGYDDLSVNDFSIPLKDAKTDFYSVFKAECLQVQ
jgi:hypothetical protein